MGSRDNRIDPAASGYRRRRVLLRQLLQQTGARRYRSACSETARSRKIRGQAGRCAEPSVWKDCRRESVRFQQAARLRCLGGKASSSSAPGYYVARENAANRRISLEKLGRCGTQKRVELGRGAATS